ncbi:putative colanic acid biosynthesis acetyltransferase [Gramella sp. BOM4]|nr:putative colanic acid biosynthesis acetyltransferase [Christiangramia bathymodioli]
MFILRSMGASVHFGSLAYGSVDIIRPWDLKMGRYTALGPRVSIYNLSNLTIGDNTVISQDVYLCGGTHDYTNSKLPLLRKTIDIGSNVWICAGAFIGPGVRIGDGAVIGARSVVLSDVPEWTIVGGNPAKYIKKRAIHD